MSWLGLTILLAIGIFAGIGLLIFYRRESREELKRREERQQQEREWQQKRLGHMTRAERSAERVEGRTAKSRACPHCQREFRFPGGELIVGRGKAVAELINRRPTFCPKCKVLLCLECAFDASNKRKVDFHCCPDCGSQVPNDWQPPQKAPRTRVKPQSRMPSPLKDFFQAAQHGDLDVIDQAIKSGIDINAKSEDGNTALIIAASNGQKQIVKALIDAKADIEIPDYQGGSAIIGASHAGHAEVVQLLVDAGANVNMRDGRGNVALHGAAFKGHVDVVKILLKAGADTESTDIHGNTALLLAAAPEIVEAMLQAGANVNAKNAYGSTALMLAEKGSEHQKAVELLRKAGAE